MRIRFAVLFVAVVGVSAAALLHADGLVGEEGAKAALTALGAEYDRAFAAGDADALVACFAPDAEYVNEEGVVRSGRGEIHTLAAGFFEEHPGARIEKKAEEVRLLGESAAVVDGLSTVFDAEGQALGRSRFTAMLVRQEGRWLIASMRDYAPPEGVDPKGRLEPLAWLVGDWVEESDAALVKSSCKWSGDGPFLLQTFTVRQPDGGTRRLTQRIGWDPLLGKIRSWAWSSEGGYGGAIWTPTEDGWLLASRGVSPTGVVGTGVHRIRRQGEDVIRWEATGQTVGDAVVPDWSHTIVRAAPEPK